MSSSATAPSEPSWRRRRGDRGGAIDMVWKDLLFLHWEVDPETVQAQLPPGLEVDTFDGRAYVGLVPFTMDRVRLWSLPRVPGFRTFHECNVRTYVRHGDVPGVYFYSLDAANPIAVLTARLVWKLNYIWARFRVETRAGDVAYRVRRFGGSSATIGWRVGQPLPASRPGTLQHFLTERYCLYSARGGRVWRGAVAHDPWQLFDAEVPSLDEELVAAAGFGVSGPPLVYAAAPVEVTGWPIRRVRGDHPRFEGSR